MANNRLRLNGMEEQRAALRNLPQELTAEASRIVEGAANGAAAEMRQNYSQGPTGNLINRVVVTHFDKGKLAAGAVVKNLAPHAAIYEWGTQRRQTAQGWDRGSMPPGRVFIPAAMRARKRMRDQLIALVERAGLKVTGV